MAFDIEREREGLEALHEIAVSSSGLLNPTALGHLVVDRARQLLRGDDATLLWYDPQPAALVVLADTSGGRSRDRSKSAKAPRALRFNAASRWPSRTTPAGSTPCPTPSIEA